MGKEEKIVKHIQKSDKISDNVKIGAVLVGCVTLFMGMLIKGALNSGNKE